MPTKKTQTPSKKSPQRKEESPKDQDRQTVPVGFIGRTITTLRHRSEDLLSRRPHRSFQRTYRRDYVRPLNLPGYWAFTGQVRRILWQNKRVILWLMVIYAVLTLFLVGLASQDTYTQLGGLLRQTSGNIFKGNWGDIGQAGLLLATAMTGDLNTSLSEGQQIYGVILVLFGWLTTVWLLRAIMAGKKPRLRDGLYNAGAPIIPTFLIFLVMIIQLLPLIVAVLGFVALLPFGILDGGAESMIFWFAASLLAMVSLYWLTSSFIALVVITLPGMYPLKAVTIAGDLVIGRRIRILFRLLWMLFTVVLGWIIVMVPVIMFDAWIKGVFSSISTVPIVPAFLLIMGTVSVVWMASYVYVLYRRIVDDDVAPA